MYPHRIRLRGPWEATFGGRVTQVHLPRDWAAFATTVGCAECHLTRNFGAPRLDNDERAWVVIEHVPSSFASLNGRMIGAGSGAFEVSRTLMTRNALTLALSSLQPTRCPEVALEIRGRAFFDSLRADSATADSCKVYGRIVDTAVEAKLEVHVLANGRPVFYREISGCPAGTVFEANIVQPLGAAIPRDGFPAWRVELIEGPQVWHRADFE